MFNQDLGISESSRKILGRFSIAARAIWVDRSLEVDSPRWRFTLAHELGHLVLHRSMKLASSDAATREGDIADTDVEIDSLETQPQRPRDWIEWQANKFAASLLMPRFPLRQGTIAAMERIGIDRLTHRIFVDNQACNVEAYGKALAMVAETFRCSRQATEIRLKELDLIYDVRQRSQGHMTALFGEEST